MEQIIQWKIIVSGKVQGVYFRASTQDKARELGLTGWVRNHRDGSVRIQVQGTDQVLDAFLEWLSTGPEQAEVSEVEWNSTDVDTFYSDFEIKR